MADGKATTESGMRSFLGFEDAVESCLAVIRAHLFPAFYTAGDGAADLDDVRSALAGALRYVLPDAALARVIDAVTAALPGIAAMLETDIEAAYLGDPAAQSHEEVILTYPAFRAIFTYRVAHALYTEQVPIVPRAMTEYAHRLTGIDIHPGATIGHHFFIDHGTGVVIGETSVIGEHVKLYQHVTIGAKSFALNPDGTPVKGIKRHPDIGDRVVIYAGATILGGETRIGDDCVIGGNVWLTHSVEAGQTVVYKI